MHVRVILFLLFGLLGCYESEDGCIDARATNFDVSADQNCCCSYPNLNLGIGFFYENGEGFRSEQVYYIDSDSFKITGIDILISEVVLIKGSDSSRVDSIITLPLVDGGSHQYIDDFAHLKMSASNSVIGRFLVLDSFDNLNFTIGLGDSNRIDPEDISTVHPLHPNNSNWTDTTGFLFMKMTVIRGMDFQDTLNLNVGGDMGKLTVALKLNTQLITQRGEHITVNLAFDVLEWISSIDMINDTKDEMKLKLYENLPNVMTVL